MNYPILRVTSIVICTIAALALLFGCDTTETSFDDSVPNFFTLNLAAIPDDGGTFNISETEFLEGEQVEIEAISSDGFLFEHWEGDLDGNSNPANLVMNDDKSVTAVFLQINTLLNVTIEGEGDVNVEFDNQTVTLNAVSPDGWSFDRWEGDLSGSENPETLLLDEEKNVTAIFVEQFTLSTGVSGEGSVDADPNRDFYDDGESVTLTANPESGWEFVEWEGDHTGRDNPTTITMDSDKSISAVFQRCVLC